MSLHPKCHLIAISGGKGGVGKSVFTANFAMSLIMDARAKVLVIDLDQNSAGDQNIILGVKPEKTVNDLVKYTGQINPQTIQQMVNKHPSGLMYLAAVRGSEERLNVDPGTLQRQLFQISPMFDYILCDLGSQIEEAQLAMLDIASAGLMLTTPEILAVTQTKRLINELVAKTLPRELFQVVVNKSNKTSMPPQNIQQMTATRVLSVIPQDDITTAGSLARSTPFVNPQGNTPIANAVRGVFRNLSGSGILQKMKNSQRPSRTPDKSSNPKNIPGAQNMNPKNLLKLRLHSGLIQEMDMKDGITDIDQDPQKQEVLRKKTTKIITMLIDREQQNFSREERAQIIKEVLDEALGLGPLENLLEDEDVTEIMVNGPDHIFVERKGKLTLSKVTFTSNEQLVLVIKRIVFPLGRQINESQPYVDARLADGSRVNAVIAPIALDGASLTIRKFSKETITPNHYIGWGSMTQSMIDFLKICVENGKNIVISGGTGSGKTTLLNVLSNFIPPTERIITVEDAAELQLNQEHVVRLETRPANMEGTGEIGIRDLVRNTLRMRPDRIVVGECRGGEALDMLQAMNTGHDGSLTTTHANSPREAIGRLETLCMMADAGLPSTAIRQQIANAVHLIVQVSRLSDGSRKIKSITELVGMQSENFTTQEIFKFKETGFDKNRKIIGEFQATGSIPTFIEEFERKGIRIPRTLFSNNANHQTNAAAAGATQKKAPAKQVPLKKVPGGRK